MKFLSALILILVVAGCEQPGKGGGGTAAPNPVKTCREALDTGTFARVAGSAYRLRVGCSLSEAQVLDQSAP
jgi:hypothetical protein